MLTINIPPKVRFVLYLIAAVGSAVVVYAMDKNLVGEAEFKLWTALAGLLSLLAASKTSTSDDAVVLSGTVAQTGPTAGDFEATLEPSDEHGHLDANMAFIIVCLIALVLVAARLG